MAILLSQILFLDSNHTQRVSHEYPDLRDLKSNLIKSFLSIQKPILLISYEWDLVNLSLLDMT